MANRRKVMKRGVRETLVLVVETKEMTGLLRGSLKREQATKAKM